MNRRDFLKVGIAGGLTLSPLSLLGQEKSSKAKSVIQIYLPGGIAHQESWIPVTDAPIEYRGPFGNINTKIQDVQFSENLKATAKISDKITVIRSMTHGEAAHERGTHNMFTAYKPSPALAYPSFGSIVSHEFGGRKNLPPYVAIPNKPNNYAGSGYLSSSFEPFSLGSSPESSSFKVRDLELPKDVNGDRFQKRKSMIQAVDAHFSKTQSSDSLNGMDSFYNQAYDLMNSKEARGAFDLNAESAAMKSFYGNHAAGQRFLLARRLVESGVRFVTVTYGSWDHHDNVERGVAGQMPSFDQAFAALITDLDQRGLLDSTLVTVTSEFGRTPKINKNAGRDHWPKLFGTVLAGGGIKRGFYYGEPDATRTEPEENPVSPEDFGATLYHLMGIDHNKALETKDKRPITIVDNGRVLNEIIA
tara:strand:+ start:624 stop:1877 length:1254 start_codon:yes stop_codon:yes gene_type:complete